MLGYTATCGQQEIIGLVLKPECKRLIISCMTRYGKTRFVAIGLLTLIYNTMVEFQSKPKRILIIAPTREQTSILRGYISELIANNSKLAKLLDEPNRSSPQRLRTEMSKQRLTFKNGWELITLTAFAGENEADPAPNLMGHGGDIIVIDEACLIRQTVYTSRISRMLGDDAANSKLIIIMNPWNKLNFAYTAWQDPAFTKIKIDWRQALSEGRTTQAYLDEQKALLTPYEWTVLYESEFAEESKDTLIRHDWIERAIKRGQDHNSIQLSGTPRLVHGLDVAEQGADKTIITDALTDGVCYQIVRQQWIRSRETMPCANEVSQKIAKKDVIQVDSIGVGAGVHSRLVELGYKAVSIRVSEAATADKERFLNQKSQRYWLLRGLFEQDKISIPNEPTLKSQLSQMRYEITSAGKIKIIDPQGKSPDYADSLMLTLQLKSYDLPFMFAF
ncbi:MAG: terminase family protein [Candidatus Bathyarchaeota archaeon]|nr:terminase family protein [Candidatus Termiticorpusculum sp.]